MATERKTRSRGERPAAPAAPASELKRIPLPPLPHFRAASRVAAPAADASPEASVEAPVPAGASPVTTPATPAAVSHLEMSELLGPRHEGGVAPILEAETAPRTGATGATIMNDLVDEIERGLEKELARAPAPAGHPVYRRVVACTGGGRRSQS